LEIVMADKAHSAGNPACKSSVPIIKRRALNRDAAILDAFEQWKTLHAQRRALPLEDNEAEFAIWDRIDAADHRVHDLPAVTPAGVAASCGSPSLTTPRMQNRNMQRCAPILTGS
jgi:hypothetical protein